MCFSSRDRNQWIEGAYEHLIRLRFKSIFWFRCDRYIMPSHCSEPLWWHQENIQNKISCDFYFYPNRPVFIFIYSSRRNGLEFQNPFLIWLFIKTNQSPLLATDSMLSVAATRMSFFTFNTPGERYDRICNLRH